MTSLKFIAVVFVGIWSAVAHAQDQIPTLNEQPSSLYTGFSQLLDDDKTLVLEELIDLDANIKRVAMYHNGDRLHRKIPKQVHLMIEIN
ncbi:hypothetical protein A3759_23620 [Thalassolituus sp. HI0120]|nr:hypothetical protein A3759_23620 [Thalassolituus sp. HI0120]